jgi:sarcosine oxidase
MTCDVAVIGLGAMGSAAAHYLTRAGARVIGLERFEPGHERGSSHGRTRIIRLGYFEHPSYVPLVQRACALWRDLEDASGEELLRVTGIVEIGPPDSELVRGTLASSQQHDLPHEVLEASEVMRRYPAFAIPDDFVGVVQPDGGFLDAERGVAAHTALAQSGGASLHYGERVQAIVPEGAGVRVTTNRRTIATGAAIVSADAWIKALLPDLVVPIRVTRQALLWTQPKDPELFAAPRFPVFMIQSHLGIHYGFPLHSDGLKVAKHYHEDESVDPERYDRTVSPRDEELIRAGIRLFLPEADGPTRAAKTCLYTMMPDGDFLIDCLPDAPQIVIVSTCSGHGFKFAPAVGEIAAALALGRDVDQDISRFTLARFAP